MEKYGERSLDNALPWSQVEPAKYVKANLPFDNFYPVVKDKYEQRIKTEKAFNLLIQELDLLMLQLPEEYILCLRKHQLAYR